MPCIEHERTSSHANTGGLDLFFLPVRACYDQLPRCHLKIVAVFSRVRRPLSFELCLLTFVFDYVIAGALTCSFERLFDSMKPICPFKD